MMSKNVDSLLSSLKSIAHMTIINALFSGAIGVCFYFNIALNNVGGVPIALEGNPVVHIPTWIFIIQVVDFFLLLALWRNFYKISTYAYVGKLINYHVAIMSVIIMGLNQIMVFVALGNNNISHGAIAKINMAGATYGALSVAFFYAAKSNNKIFGDL